MENMFMIHHAFRQAIDPRRRNEVADSRMIQEDQHAMSNLPTEGFQRQFNPDRTRKADWSTDEIGW